MSVILRTAQLVSGVGLVLSHRHRHPVADRVAADDESAGVYARTSYRSLQHLGIFHRVAQLGVLACLCLPQFGYALDGIAKVHLQSVGQFVGYELAQGVGLVERQFLHSRHVLDGVLGCHRTICNNVCAVLMPVFVLHPFQYLAASVVVEVGVDIGQ